MPQLNLERLIEAIDRHTNAVECLTESVQALAAAKDLAVTPDDKPTDAPIDLESFEAMTARVKTLFNTDGIEGVFPPALPSLLRAGGHEATINEAVYQLTQDPAWLELHADGMLRKV